jgi:hypothetical protein
VKSEKTDTRILTSGPEWKCSTDTVTNWSGLEFNDTVWKQVQKMKQQPSVALTGFPDKVPPAMWSGDGTPGSPQYAPAPHLAFRRVFFNYDVLKDANLTVIGIDDYTVYFNEKRLEPQPGDTADWTKAKTWNLMGKMRDGKNVLAIYVTNNIRMGYGLMPLISYTVSTSEFLPQPPQSVSPLDPRQAAEGAYRFPAIANFAIPAAQVNKKQGQ